MVASLAWGGYSNGYIPDSAMVSIGRGFKLEAGAARQFNAARKETLRVYGVDMLDFVSETYRDYAGQVYQKQRWTALGKPQNAADPGGSIHGWAKAVDFNVDAMAAWQYNAIMTVLAKYGFVRDVSGESWHVSYREALVGAWASLSDSELDEVEQVNALLAKGHDMIIIHSAQGTVAAAGELSGTLYTSMEGGQGFSVAANKEGYGPSGGFVEVSSDNVAITLVNEANARGDAFIARIKTALAAA